MKPFADEEVRKLGRTEDKLFEENEDWGPESAGNWLYTENST